MAPATYWLSTPTSGQQPYLYLAQAANQQPTVTVPLDQVFTTPPSGTLPAAAPFAVQQGSGKVVYQVAVDPSIWKFDDSPIRSAVRTGFDDFLKALDAQGLKGGRLALIRGWLAQVLPQTFAESLYFRYGLDVAQRCVELGPGMRLRVDFQAHQAVDPGTSSLNGFVSTGRGYVEVGQVAGAQSGLVLGFDPFLSRLQGFTVGASTAATGGLVDLQGPAHQLPYWRLYYPASYPGSDGTGFAGPAQNPVLIGASTRAVLEAAGAQYVGDGSIASNAVGVWFRGRVTVVPEIPVLVQNQVRHITLGTTLRDLFAGFEPMPWVPGAMSTQFLSRLASPLTATNDLQWQPLRTYQVVSLGSPAYNTYADTLDAFDLPLVGGDSVSFPATG
jgi:hypothetical protein